MEAIEKKQIREHKGERGGGCYVLTVILLSQERDMSSVHELHHGAKPPGLIQYMTSKHRVMSRQIRISLWV